VTGSLIDDRIEFTKSYADVNCHREELMDAFGLGESQHAAGEGEGVHAPTAMDIAALSVQYRGAMADGILRGTYSIIAEEEMGIKLETGGAFELGVGFIEGSSEICPPVTALAMLTGLCGKQAPQFLIPLLAKTKRFDVRDFWGDSLILWACRWGHTEAVLKAIEWNDPDEIGVHTHSCAGRTALELAIVGRHREIAFAILSTWSEEEIYSDAQREGDFVGMNILEQAIKNGWQDVAALFVRVVQPFQATHPQVRSALYTCVEKQWLDCLAALLDRGADPSCHQDDGNIPILTASKMNFDEALRLLLDAGARDLEIAITVAVYCGHEKCFELLWQRAVKTGDLVRTAACLAALTNNLEILRVVLRAEKPDHLLHRYGRKVRAIVNSWYPKTVFDRLLPHLSWTLQDEDPSAPLLCAVARGHMRITSYLLERHADPLIQNDNGLTPLTWACAQGNLDIVKVLLKKGASVSLAEGLVELSFAELKTAFFNARLNSANTFLARHHPLLQAPDETHKIQLTLSPLLVALLKGHPDVVRLLLEAGASRSQLAAWCSDALDADPRSQIIVHRMMQIAVEYEDFKTFGPFGVKGSSINYSDAKYVPHEGRLASIIIQFSECEWSLEAIQFVHEVDGQHQYCKRHRTRLPHAGDWETTNQNMHIERMDLAPSEYIIQAEVAVGEEYIVSLRFTTNRRVTKWLGGTTDPTQFPKGTCRITTVNPLGREIVGLFSAAETKWLRMGFITRLRMGDHSWRPKGPAAGPKLQAERKRSLNLNLPAPTPAGGVQGIGPAKMGGLISPTEQLLSAQVAELEAQKSHMQAQQDTTNFARRARV